MTNDTTPMTRPLSELPNREGFRFRANLITGGPEVKGYVFEPGMIRYEYDKHEQRMVSIRDADLVFSGWLPECSTCGGDKFTLDDELAIAPCPECGTKERT